MEAWRATSDSYENIAGTGGSRQNPRSNAGAMFMRLWKWHSEIARQSIVSQEKSLETAHYFLQAEVEEG